jgi:outer membrane receptor protein involved in Fe transport
MQVSRFDPQNVSILTFIENSADSEIRGVEGDIIWAATDAFTVFAAFSYNDTELTDISAEIVELAPVGSELPLVPEFQAVLRGRYNWFLADGYNAYAQAAVQYADTSYSSLIAAEREKQDSYTTLDAAVGVAKDAWKTELFIENLTDERADLFINTQDEIRRTATNRPRTVSLRFSIEL